MIAWKQHLYAFLLRRVLGPFLDAESLQKLHKSIEVSLQDGRISLKHIALNVDQLNVHMNRANKISNIIDVQAVRVDKLEIVLSVQETTTHQSAAPSSLAWRALHLGTPSVRLFVEVIVDGVHVELVPAAGGQATDDETTSSSALLLELGPPSDPVALPNAGGPDAQDAANTKAGVLTSYLDAALSSLQLSLNMRHLHVKFCCPKNAPAGLHSSTNNETEDRAPATWLELRLLSLSYQDVDPQQPPVAGGANAAPTILKAIDIGNVVVVTSNDTALAVASKVAFWEGTGRIRFRAEQTAATLLLSSDDDDAQTTMRLHQSIDVQCHPKFQFLFDEAALIRLATVLDVFQRQPPLADDAVAVPSRAGESTAAADEDDDDTKADLRTLDGIMKQYKAARRLAENNQMRGGMLLPSDDDGDAHATFDVFFDANDQSLYHYSTILRQSILAEQQQQRDDGDAAFVHSQFNLYAPRWTIKLSLFTHEYARPEEYVLFTAIDVKCAMSASTACSEFNVSILQLDIEESHVPLPSRATAPSSRHFNPRPVIGNLLTFVSPPKDINTIPLDAPCISVHIRKERKIDSKSNGNQSIATSFVNTTLEPIEFVFRPDTFFQFGRLSKAIASTRRVSERRSIGDCSKSWQEGATVIINFDCPGMDIIIPVNTSREWSSLFSRRVRMLPFLSTSIWTSALGAYLENVAVNFTFNGKLTFSSHNLAISALMPVHGPMDRSVQKVTLLALCGRNEIEPAIPVCVTYQQRCADDNGHERAATPIFPRVPAISTFKARQQDDDDSDDGTSTRVTSSKPGNFNLTHGKSLQGADPQAAMADAASQCDADFSITIPEILVDVTTHEISVLKSAIGALLRVHNESSRIFEQSNSRLQRSTRQSQLRITCLCQATSATLVLRSGHNLQTAFLAELARLKSHIMTSNGQILQCRVLAHDFEFYEASGISPSVEQSDSAIRECCFDELRHVATALNRHGSVVPLIYRSHLFAPISTQSPNVLIDVLRQAESSDSDLDSKDVYVTFYDLSYRLDLDSDWMLRFRTFINELRAPSPNVEEQTLAKASDSEIDYMTRLFVIVSDCNADYASPIRFETAARVLLRLGDFRLTTTFMTPPADKQAFSVSCGDLELYLCNSRHHRSYEDSKLMLWAKDAASSCGASATEGDAALRKMNSRVILTLDSVDLVFITMQGKESTEDSEPYLRVSLNAGELNLMACKDSFRSFTAMVSEVVVDTSAISELDLRLLDTMSARNTESDTSPVASSDNISQNSLDELKRQSALRPSIGSGALSPKEFLLDGYDWTTIEVDATNRRAIPDGEEQSARWYGARAAVDIAGQDEVGVLAGISDATQTMAIKPRTLNSGPRIIPYHFPLYSSKDSLASGDMNAAKYAETNRAPPCKLRLVLRRMGISLRLFDGYDWPEMLSSDLKDTASKRDFVIERMSGDFRDEKRRLQVGIKQRADVAQLRQLERKAALMGGLLSEPAEAGPDLFESVPLPDERAAKIKESRGLRRLGRQHSHFFQMSCSGLVVRLDSFADSTDHRLASCLHVAADDFVVLETISGSTKPVKFMGEWVNDKEHPRDTQSDLFRLKMVTWHPLIRVTDKNTVVNNECEACLTLLPLRCIIDQRVVRFVSFFFAADETSDPKIERSSSLPPGRYAVPPPLVRKFRVRPFKMKVDYMPQRIDGRALRDGAFVELINIAPLDGLVLTLQQVIVENVVGLGAVVPIVVRSWIEDVCATQLLKFLTNARPFEPVTNVVGSAVDMIVLPWEAVRHGDSLTKAVRASLAQFANAVTFETLTTTSRVSGFVADQTRRFTGQSHHPTSPERSSTLSRVSSAQSSGSSSLPTRPPELPRNVYDTSKHALESLARGLQQANYTIVIVPYREYVTNGASGAVRSVLRGIPVAIAAPASGMAEALSYTLLGARNQLHPDARKEEEYSGNDRRSKDR